MNKTLVKLLQSGKIGDGDLYLLDTYNQAVHEEVACTITTRINDSNQHFIIHKGRMKDFLGYGRSRSSTDSNVLTRHFNPYVNCLHSQVGTARENMEVLITEFDMSEIKYVGQMSSSQNSRVIEPITYAMRGRNPENPSERGRSDGKYKQRIEMGSNISNTITSVQKDALVAEPQGVDIPYRIRKLTPRECFRLMGVSETDIDKIQQSGVSQSQQYRMAGNSIVVDVLEHIFRKMFIDIGQESQQLSLF